MNTIVVCASLTAIAYFALQFWKPAEKPPRTTESLGPLVMRTPGGLLEVSTIHVTEKFETKENHAILGIHIGKTIARIRVPADYRYHIELAPEWKIFVKDKTFVVAVPEVKASLPVAIDTSHLESESSGTWSLITGTTTIAELQRAITPELAKKAESSSYIQLQRPYARKTVAEFVQKWLITQERWKNVSGYSIRVFFPD